MKNYNESMLESMTNGVITMDEDGMIVTCNAAVLRILHVQSDDILNRKAEDFFSGANAWIMEKIKDVGEMLESDVYMDAEMEVTKEEDEKETISANITFLPLLSSEDKKLGAMVMIEDISTEKRMKSTMSRYMDPGLADQLMGESQEDIMGGKDTIATLLFSDVRGFTTITETLGAQGTVALLN